MRSECMHVSLELFIFHLFLFINAEGAIIRMKQLADEKKANAERDADLPPVPSGSLGTFKRGLQSMPLKVQEILGDKKVRLGHKMRKIRR